MTYDEYKKMWVCTLVMCGNHVRGPKETVPKTELEFGEGFIRGLVAQLKLSYPEKTEAELRAMVERTRKSLSE